MPSSSPRVVVSQTAGATATEVERPKIAESSGAELVDWSATRGGSDPKSPVLLTGCVATRIPGWVEDMRPVVEARAVGLTGAAAAKITSSGVDLRAGKDGVFDLRPASDLSGPVIGYARTFVGFDASHLFTCFAICAPPPPAIAGEAARACGTAVAGARLEGSLEPPRPGLALRGATWAVHHPRPAALGGLGLIAIVGVLAVFVRRRPRSTVAQ